MPTLIRLEMPSDGIVDANQKLLSGGGVWCILTMEELRASMRVIADLKPIQVANVDLDDYTSFEDELDKDAIVVRGLNPEYFSQRQSSSCHASRSTWRKPPFHRTRPKGWTHNQSSITPRRVGGDVEANFVNRGNVDWWARNSLNDEYERKEASAQMEIWSRSCRIGQPELQPWPCRFHPMAFVHSNGPTCSSTRHLFDHLPHQGRVHHRQGIPGWEVRISPTKVT